MHLKVRYDVGVHHGSVNTPATGFTQIQIHNVVHIISTPNLIVVNDKWGLTGNAYMYVNQFRSLIHKKGKKSKKVLTTLVEL